MRILWIEDEPTISEETFFGADIFSLHEIKRIVKFEDAYRAITDDIEQYDFIVIDIDLSESLIEDSHNAQKIMNDFGFDEERNGLEKFKTEAGFHLTIKLIEKGFPKDRIVILTGNISSEDGKIEEIIESVQEINKKGSKNLLDGVIEPLKGQLDKDEVIELEKAKKSGDLENFLSKFTSENTVPSQTDPTYTTFKRKFKDAGIIMPRGIHKSNKKNFETWFDRKLVNNTVNPSKVNYLILRRGILNVLDHIEVNKKIKIHDDFLKKDFDTLIFINGLRWLMKAPELSDEESGQFY